MKFHEKAGVVVISLAIAAVAMAAAAQQQSHTNAYFQGATCIASANCSNCLGGNMSDPSNCKLSPKLQCFVWKGTTTATFAWCIDTGDATQLCKVTMGDDLDPPAAVCPNSNFWRCGCANADGYCGIAACTCGPLPPDGNKTYTLGVSLCTVPDTGGT